MSERLISKETISERPNTSTMDDGEVTSTKDSGNDKRGLDINILSGAATSAPLPPDAATETTLASVLAKLIAAPSTEDNQDVIIASLAALLTELQLKADLTETQPVSAASLPLPSGAATEAKQDDTITRLTNVISTDNSSTTPLGGGATFTGTGEDVSVYASVGITIFSDVDSAASGMRFQFSTNGSSWDDSNNFTLDVSVSGTRKFQFPVTAQFFRVVFTNGAGAQSAFRLQTIFHTTNILTTIHRMDSELSRDRSATVTKSVIAGRHQEDQIHTTTVDGDYDILTLDSLGSLHTNGEAHHVFDDLDVITGWAATDTDTENIAATTIHALGLAAITFDKANTGANNTLAFIEKTVTTVDIGSVSAHDILQAIAYFSSTSDIDYVFCRLGSDSSNYNEWRIDGEALTAGEFEPLAFTVADPSHTGSTGTGWDSTQISYIALGANFDAQQNTLTGIIFDQFSYHTNQHVSASINSEVTSSVSSPNVRVTQWTGSVDTNIGNASNGTLRTVLASDQPTVTVQSSTPTGVAIGSENPFAIAGVSSGGSDRVFPVGIGSISGLNGLLCNVGGNVGNGSPDGSTSPPVKIGGRATDQDGFGPVDDQDRVNAWFSLNGILHTANHSHARTVIDLPALNDTFDDVTSTVSSASFSTNGFRICKLHLSIVSANAPTTLTYTLESLNSDASTQHVYENGIWANLSYEDSVTDTTAINRAIVWETGPGTWRITITAVGTDASKTFITTNHEIEMAT